MLPTSELEGRILFHETRASGRSLKNWVTKYGGASGCLTVIVTDRELITDFSFSSLPPFSLLPKLFRKYYEQAIARQGDLSHRIPRQNIVSFSLKPALWRKAYLVEYRIATGWVSKLEICPMDDGGFERALNTPPKAI